MQNNIKLYGFNFDTLKDFNSDFILTDAENSETVPQNEQVSNLMNDIVSNKDEDSVVEIEVNSTDAEDNSTSSSQNTADTTNDNIQQLYDKAKKLTQKAEQVKKQLDLVTSEINASEQQRQAKQKEYEKIIKEIENKKAQREELIAEHEQSVQQAQEEKQSEYEKLQENIQKDWENGKYGLKPLEEVMKEELSNFDFEIDNDTAQINVLTNEINTLSQKAEVIKNQINNFENIQNSKQSVAQALQNQYNDLVAEQNKAVAELNLQKENLGITQNSATKEAVSANATGAGAAVNASDSVGQTAEVGNVNNSSNVTSVSAAKLDTIADADKIDWDAKYVEGLGINLTKIKDGIGKKEDWSMLSDEDYKALRHLNKLTLNNFYGYAMWTGNKQPKHMQAIKAQKKTDLQNYYNWDLDGNGFLSTEEIDKIKNIEVELAEFKKMVSNSGCKSIKDYEQAVKDGKFGEYGNLVSSSLHYMTEKIDDANVNLSSSAKNDYKKDCTNLLQSYIENAFISTKLKDIGRSKCTTVINGTPVTICKDAIYDKKDAKVMYDTLIAEIDKAEASGKSVYMNEEIIQKTAAAVTETNGGTAFDPYDIEALDKAGMQYHLATHRNEKDEIVVDDPPHATEYIYQYQSSCG